MRLQVAESIEQIPAASWNALKTRGNPFLRWEWLHAFETGGCLGPRKGWAPLHLTIWDESQLVAACPVYIKGHSMGEFIFDQEWARFFEVNGAAYYPKLLVAVPFTPATGPRFLTIPGRDRGELIKASAVGLLSLLKELNYSSVHVNFCLPDEGAVLESLGFLRRETVQFHWRNRGYTCFDDYLASLKHKRRKEIKRELRKLDQEGVVFQMLSGADITRGHMKSAFEFYRGHVARFYWGKQYLTEAFFERLYHCFRDYLRIIFAERDGEVLGCAFSIAGGGVYYGRYWGGRDDAPRFLHFAACYYRGIEQCIDEGIQIFEPGAGGEFKQLRGFDPTLTYSYHYIKEGAFHQAIGRHLEYEKQAVGEYRDALNGHSQYRSDLNDESGREPTLGAADGPDSEKNPKKGCT